MRRGVIRLWSKWLTLNDYSEWEHVISLSLEVFPSLKNSEPVTGCADRFQVSAIVITRYLKFYVFLRLIGITAYDTNLFKGIEPPHDDNNTFSRRQAIFLRAAACGLICNTVICNNIFGESCITVWNDTVNEKFDEYLKLIGPGKTSLVVNAVTQKDDLSTLFTDL